MYRELNLIGYECIPTSIQIIFIVVFYNLQLKKILIKLKYMYIYILVSCQVMQIENSKLTIVFICVLHIFQVDEHKLVYLVY